MLFVFWHQCMIWYWEKIKILGGRPSPNSFCIQCANLKKPSLILQLEVHLHISHRDTHIEASIQGAWFKKNQLCWMWSKPTVVMIRFLFWRMSYPERCKIDGNGKLSYFDKVLTPTILPIYFKVAIIRRCAFKESMYIIFEQWLWQFPEHNLQWG